MRVNKKCWVLHVSHNKPMQHYRQGTERLENGLAEKDLGVLVDSQLNRSQQCSQEGQQHLGLYQKLGGQQNWGSDQPLYLALVKPYLEYCIQFWTPDHKKDIEVLNFVQKRATKVLKGLEHKFSEKWLRMLFSTAKGRKGRLGETLLLSTITLKEAVESSLLLGNKRQDRRE